MADPFVPKIIVFDDDPTGSQTVHSCLLLLRWDVASLVRGLRDESPIFFVLTNTRSLSPQTAAAVTREVCQNLQQALAQTGITRFLLVSRSDSTLRGHYPLETDVIQDCLGPFDATFLVPAFFEGGRITVQGTHYIEVEVEQRLGQDQPSGEGQAPAPLRQRIPVHETEFACDTTFGFCSSYLPDYVEEKTQGRIPAQAVKLLDGQTIRAGQGLTPWLLALADNACVAVDGEYPSDLETVAASLREAASRGKRFLFRSAASLLTALAQLPPQPIAPADMAQLRRSAAPGAIVIGSHVAKTNVQLTELLAQPDVLGIEVAVARLWKLWQQGVGSQEIAQNRIAQNGISQNGMSHREMSPQANPIDARQQWLQQLNQQIAQGHQAGKTPVIYTSREAIAAETGREIAPPRSHGSCPANAEITLAFGRCISDFLMELVAALPQDISFLISKGGNTSNNILSQALALNQVRLVGQLIPGVCLVQTAAAHPRFPSLPVLLFPGNVGDSGALTLAYRLLQGEWT